MFTNILFIIHLFVLSTLLAQVEHGSSPSRFVVPKLSVGTPRALAAALAGRQEAIRADTSVNKPI